MCPTEDKARQAQLPDECLCLSCCTRNQPELKFLYLFKPKSGPDVSVLQRVDGKVFEQRVARTYFGDTKCLRRYIQIRKDEWLRFTSDQVCMRHHRGECTQGSDCSLLHLCRHVWRPAASAVASPAPAPTPNTVQCVPVSAIQFLQSQPQFTADAVTAVPMKRADVKSLDTSTVQPSTQHTKQRQPRNGKLYRAPNMIEAAPPTAPTRHAKSKGANRAETKPDSNTEWDGQWPSVSASLSKTSTQYQQQQPHARFHTDNNTSNATCIPKPQVNFDKGGVAALQAFANGFYCSVPNEVKFEPWPSQIYHWLPFGTSNC